MCVYVWREGGREGAERKRECMELIHVSTTHVQCHMLCEFQTFLRVR